MVSSGCTRTGIHCAAIRISKKSWPRLRLSRLGELGVRCPARRELALAVRCASRQIPIVVIDRIHIEQLEIHGRVGVLDSERAGQQRLIFNVTLWPEIVEPRDD